MNDRDFISRIKQELNYGTGQLPAQISERLKQGREQAVAAYAMSCAQQPEMALPGMQGSVSAGFLTRKWISFAMLILVLLGGVYWQQHLMPLDDDSDAGLLSSDLPLNALVDQNFHLWLDQSQQQ